MLKEVQETSKEAEEEVYEAEVEVVTRHRTSKALSGCRVLHLCGLREPDPLPPVSPTRSAPKGFDTPSDYEPPTAAIQLPDADVLSKEKVKGYIVIVARAKR